MTQDRHREAEQRQQVGAGLLGQSRVDVTLQLTDLALQLTEVAPQLTELLAEVAAQPTELAAQFGQLAAQTRLGEFDVLLRGEMLPSVGRMHFIRISVRSIPSVSISPLTSVWRSASVMAMMFPLSSLRLTSRGNLSP